MSKEFRLTEWLAKILAVAGKRTADVVAVAATLRDNGPSTTEQIMEVLGQTQRKRIDHATDLGCQIGLFTCSVGARGLQTFALMTDENAAADWTLLRGVRSHKTGQA